VVEAGLTVAVPEAGRELLPGDIEIDVAPETLQLRLEFPPRLMPDGVAVKETIIGEEDGNEVGGSEVGGSEVGGNEVGGNEVGADGAVTAIVTD
jgi:hypothetical protein